MAVDLPICTVDFETRSFLSVKDVGAWRYAEDFTTEILCLSYKFDDDKTGLWIPGLDFPQEIVKHVEAGGTFEAHNAQFERAIWMLILRPQFGIPMPTRWTTRCWCHCTGRCQLERVRYHAGCCSQYFLALDSDF